MTRTLAFRPLWLGLALAGMVSTARADGTLVEVHESVIADLAPARSFDPYGRPYRRPGVGVGVGVGVGRVGLGVDMGFQRYDPFALERALDEVVSSRRAALAGQARRRGGFLIAFQVGTRQLDPFGWRLRGAAQVRAWLILPDATAAQDALALGGRRVLTGLRLNLALQGQGGATALVPVALEEASRLEHGAKGDRDTVLGAALRGAWSQVGGKKSSKGKVTLEVADRAGQALARVDGPSIDPVLGRRGMFSRLWARLTRKQDAQLPALDPARSAELGSALARAERLADLGARAELARQVALRRGPLAALPSRSGLVDTLSGR